MSDNIVDNDSSQDNISQEGFEITVPAIISEDVNGRPSIIKLGPL